MIQLISLLLSLLFGASHGMLVPDNPPPPGGISGGGPVGAPIPDPPPKPGAPVIVPTAKST